MEEKNEMEVNPLMNTLEGERKGPVFSIKLIAALIFVVVLGIGTGYLLSQGSSNSTLKSTFNLENASKASKGTVVGSDDIKTFKDTAEGRREEGGADGEGQFHLVRPGGESQNVYLTSSIVDLSQFLKKRIKVWGETQKAQHAGWLMDVGKLEVLE